MYKRMVLDFLKKIDSDKRSPYDDYQIAKLEYDLMMEELEEKRREINEMLEKLDYEEDRHVFTELKKLLKYRNEMALGNVDESRKELVNNQIEYINTKIKTLLAL